MKILHTADVHLRSTDDGRWRALEHILSLADEQGVSLIVISGDLFDRRIDGQSLKLPLRELFQASGTRVVILPGNHDALALSAGDYYGENVTVLADPHQSFDIGNVRLLGLPFEKIFGDKMIENLLSMRSRIKRDATNILLYHGELLDLVFARDGFGDEEDSGYMPVRLSSFDDLGFDYVLAGHFHTNFDIKAYRGGYFVYPGSPASVTKKELGVRNVNLFEVGKPPCQFELNTAHYESLEVLLNPFTSRDPISEIRQRIDVAHPKARVLLKVSGFVDLVELGQSETEFAAAIRSLETPQIEAVHSCWMDIGAVRESDLFKRFAEKLERSTLSMDRQSAIRTLALESMMEALHAN